MYQKYNVFPTCLADLHDETLENLSQISSTFQTKNPQPNDCDSYVQLCQFIHPYIIIICNTTRECNINKIIYVC
jgi:hypothetical protein